jgi:hypothetical protein
MSLKPIDHSPALRRLVSEGYEIEVMYQHLLVHSIPHVTADQEIALGTLVCPYIEANGADSKPPDHVVVHWRNSV